ncbi:MAG: T9SS type A sorting domain-containing protein [Bacteroidia bacterium]|nr:T9SS type A sorting domain-containing protein [Bacteroidia bacterium]
MTIKLNSEIYGLRYKLTTIGGEIVQSSDYLSDRINVEKLPNGLYFLQLYNDFYSVTRKILIFH